MRLHRSIVLAAALIVPAVAAGAAAGDTRDPRPASTTAAPSALASELRRTVDAGAPGVIALINDGHGIRLYARGSADTRGDRPMRPTDRFRAGSVTKPVLATVALQLVAEGRLSLDDTVARWLPGILPDADRVTLRQLLNHTSGVPDNQGPVDAEFYRGHMTRSWGKRELVRLVADQPLDFAPGTSWSYSNTGYMLAGLIIERATGRSLGHEIKQRVLEPLHMTHSSFPHDTLRIAGSHARGYAAVGSEVRDVTVLNPSGAWAAGNLVSTARELARFWRALLGGRLLQPAQLAEMKTTVPVAEGSPLGYGLGIIGRPSECGMLWGHGGDIAGYSNYFQNTEDGTRQAAVITNMNPSPDTLNEQVEVTKQVAISTAAGRSC